MFAALLSALASNDFMTRAMASLANTWTWGPSRHPALVAPSSVPLPTAVAGPILLCLTL